MNLTAMNHSIMKHRVLKIHPKDNVVVALEDLSKGEGISFNGIVYTFRDYTPEKHKFYKKNMRRVMK